MEHVALESALARIDNDHEIYRELIVVFLEDSKTDIQQLSQAIKENDTKKAIYHTHKLKGAALTLGAEYFSSQAECLEQKLNKSEARVCLEPFEKMEEAYQGAITRLKEIQGVLQKHS